MLLCFSPKCKFNANLLKVDFCPCTHLVIVRSCFNMPPFLLERLLALTQTFELCRHFQPNKGSDYSYLCSNEPPYKLPSPACTISFHPLVLLFLDTLPISYFSEASHLSLLCLGKGPDCTNLAPPLKVTSNT